MKLPDDWRAWALEKGMDPYTVDEIEWKRFRHHYASKGEESAARPRFSRKKGVIVLFCNKVQ